MCSTRKENIYDGVRARNCSTSFNVVKMYKQNFVCYSFEVKYDRVFQYSQITNSFSGFDFYEIILRNTSFQGSPYTTFFVTQPRKEWRGVSANFVENFRDLNNVTQMGARNFVAL